MKCMIVDDEIMAIRILDTYIQSIDGLEVVARCQSAMEAFSNLRRQQIDLILLDIQMPQLSGLNFIRSLRTRPHIILTTAHREYALDGFDLDVVDYLLKPISMERFIQALDKIYRIESPKLSAAIAPASAATTTPPFIYITSDRQSVKIQLQDIRWIESMKNHVRIHLLDQRLITLQPIGQLEKKLPEQHFIRVHRSFIAGLQHIDRFTHTNLEIGGQLLPIGRSYRKEVIRRLSPHQI